jgi:hypothetical protein
MWSYLFFIDLSETWWIRVFGDGKFIGDNDFAPKSVFGGTVVMGYGNFGFFFGNNFLRLNL